MRFKIRQYRYGSIRTVKKFAWLIGRAFGKTSEHIGGFLKAHGYKSKKGKKGGKL